MNNLIIWFKDCSYKNKHLVGGKCSSLGELYYLSKKLYFSIADGFAITTVLYEEFIKNNNLEDIIANKLKTINTENIRELEEESRELRKLILNGKFSLEQEKIILNAYDELSGLYRKQDLEVAVRSSAIAEDLPNASFAGQQDTLLNVTKSNLLESIKICFSSLFNSRAISYRKTHSIEISQVKISVAIQKMVRSDLGSAGVAFSIDPETGYDKAIVINSSFGLGELVVSGGVKPDEYILDKRVLRDIEADPIIMKKKGDKGTKIIYKENGGTIEIETSGKEKINYSLTNHQAITLGRYVLLLEQNYSKIFGKRLGVDVEWALDGIDQNIYIIQTRPETIHSNESELVLNKYILKSKSQVILTGVAVGEKISSGKVKILESMEQFDLFEPGDILVTDMTTPDWEPLMKISSGIITNKGGRTCHAAIVARELGLNAVVGTSNGTSILKSDSIVTLSCAEGEQANVYDGKLDWEIESVKLDSNINLPIGLMLNVGNPENSFVASKIPSSGVGLARLEFIISNYIQIHPIALCDYPKVREDIREKIYNIIGSHDSGKWYFIKRLARGISKIASAFYPNPIIVRLSDFKSNEYKNLIGGDLYEPDEENPLLGYRGANRYYSDDYKEAFELECEAIKYAREEMKMTNIIVMIPFCRTPEECRKVLEIMKSYGLERGKNGLQVYIMCEIPSNVIEADEFSPYIDGVSIGSNDLLMLTLGIDRDSEKVAYLCDHTNLSFRRLLKQAIQQYKKNGKKVGLCGQQASDSVEFCKFLIDCGIDSISVVPDSAIKTINNLKTLIDNYN
jgi:pyruvate,water dikinase